jgi:hypothetical protein
VHLCKAFREAERTEWAISPGITKVLYLCVFIRTDRRTEIKSEEWYNVKNLFYAKLWIDMTSEIG